ncbi:hypothetical protein [Kitasatospora sp. P5_F3]
MYEGAISSVLVTTGRMSEGLDAGKPRICNRRAFGTKNFARPRCKVEGLDGIPGLGLELRQGANLVGSQ